MPFHAQRSACSTEVGLRIGELSLADNFTGVLAWDFMDNRPVRLSNAVKKLQHLEPLTVIW